MKVEKDVTKLNYLDDFLLNDNNVVIEDDKLEWMKEEEDVWKFMNQKESLLKQKTKSSGFQHGDKNSKFIHTMMKTRIRINTITSLSTSQGRVDSVVDIKEATRKFFKVRFTEPDKCEHGLENI